MPIEIRIWGDNVGEINTQILSLLPNGAPAPVSSAVPPQADEAPPPAEETPTPPSSPAAESSSGEEPTPLYEKVTPLQDIEALTTTAKNALSRVGVLTIADTWAKDPNEIKRVKGVSTAMFALLSDIVEEVFEADWTGPEVSVETVFEGPKDAPAPKEESIFDDPEPEEAEPAEAKSLTLVEARAKFAEIGEMVSLKAAIETLGEFNKCARVSDLPEADYAAFVKKADGVIEAAS